MSKLEQKSETWVLTEAEALDIFAFLISSARTQLDDPASYASMRLLTVFEDLRDIVKERMSENTQNLLENTVDLTADAQLNILDIEYYTNVLDELNRAIAHFLVEKSGLGSES